MPRVDLNVLFKDKNDAKALGACWDAGNKTWYVPDGLSIDGFTKWLQDGFNGDISNIEKVNVDSSKGVSLYNYLHRVKAIITNQLSKLEWIHGEIANINERNGHLYLELIESINGAQVAKVRANIWKLNAATIQNKFKDLAGCQLAIGQKVLLQVSSRYHEMYGFSVVVEDIDPSYTLGDMEAKLQKLRVLLNKEGIFNNNKNLLIPQEITRVAVLAPQDAAGLGDFYSIMNQLVTHGLCELTHYPATFQGDKSEKSLFKACQKVYQAQEDNTYDLMVIIRGGGAKIDLAWMNNESLARAICNSPLPVFTGIGHQRDVTLPDEIALRAFETPSALAGFIHHVIVDNAREAGQFMKQIRLNAQLLINDARACTKDHKNAIEHQSIKITSHTSSLLEKQFSEMKTTSMNSLVSAQEQMRRAHQNISVEAKHRVHAAKLSCDTQILNVRNNAKKLPTIARKQFHAYLQQIASASKRDMTYMRTVLQTKYGHVFDMANKETSLARINLERSIKSISSNAHNLTHNTEKKAELMYHMVLAYGADATLKRGFSLARNNNGKILSSYRDASVENHIELEFHDGKLDLINVNGENKQ